MCSVLCAPGPHTVIQPANTNIEMVHNSCTYIVLHSYHWKHSLFFVFIAENQNYLIHGFIPERQKVVCLNWYAKGEQANENIRKRKKKEENQANKIEAAYDLHT